MWEPEFKSINLIFDTIQRSFDQIDKRFDQLDKKFDKAERVFFIGFGGTFFLSLIVLIKICSL